MEWREIAPNKAEKWGKVYGRKCVAEHGTYPDEITCRGTLVRTCKMLRRSFDEPAFVAFFNAAKRAANEARAELARMKLEIRQTSDRNGKLYEITFHGQIVGNADDESTVERVRDILAAAYAEHGEDAFLPGHAPNAAAKKALLDAGLENVASVC